MFPVQKEKFRKNSQPLSLLAGPLPGIILGDNFPPD